MGEALSHPKQEWGGTELLYGYEWGRHWVTLNRNGEALSYSIERNWEARSYSIERNGGGTELLYGQEWGGTELIYGQEWGGTKYSVDTWATELISVQHLLIDRNGGTELLYRLILVAPCFLHLCVHRPGLQFLNVSTRMM